MTDNYLSRQTCNFIKVFFHCHTFDDITKSNGTLNLSKNGIGIRIPFYQRLSLLNFLTITDFQLRSIHNRKSLFFSTGFILNHKASISIHYNDFARLVFQGPEPHILNDSPTFSVQSCLLNHSTRGSTNMEGSHRQLRARLTYRLRCNNTHRFTNLNPLKRCHVATVTLNTNTLFRLTGQAGTHFNFFNTGIFNSGNRVFLDQTIGFRQNVSSERIDHIFKNSSPQNSFTQRLNNFAGLNQRNSIDAFQCATIFLLNNHVLRNINQTTREVTGICGFERGIR